MGTRASFEFGAERRVAVGGGRGGGGGLPICEEIDRISQLRSIRFRARCQMCRLIFQFPLGSSPLLLPSLPPRPTMFTGEPRPGSPWKPRLKSFARHDGDVKEVAVFLGNRASRRARIVTRGDRGIRVGPSDRAGPPGLFRRWW